MYQLLVDIIFSFLIYYLIIKYIKIDMESRGTKVSYKLAMTIFLIVYSPFFAMIVILLVLNRSGIRISSEISHILYIITLLISGTVGYIVYHRKSDLMNKTKSSEKSVI